MKLVFIGGPGSGKGTRAKLISKEFDIPHISTGDICRDHVKNKGRYAEYIQDCMNKGLLTKDEVTLELLNERLVQKDCENGFILDGVPRTIGQAERIKDIDHVLFLDCPEGILIERLTLRRVCNSCGEIYNLSNPEVTPKEEGKCDKCSSELIQRDDDKEEIIRDRLKVYNEQTKPLLDFYKDKLKSFNASGEIEKSVDEISAFLRKGPVV